MWRAEGPGAPAAGSELCSGDQCGAGFPQWCCAGTPAPQSGSAAPPAGPRCSTWEKEKSKTRRQRKRQDWMTEDRQTAVTASMTGRDNLIIISMWDVMNHSHWLGTHTHATHTSPKHHRQKQHGQRSVHQHSLHGTTHYHVCIHQCHWG